MSHYFQKFTSVGCLLRERLESEGRRQRAGRGSGRGMVTETLYECEKERKTEYFRYQALLLLPANPIKQEAGLLL